MHPHAAYVETLTGHLDKSLVQGLSPFSAAAQDAEGRPDFSAPAMPGLQVHRFFLVRLPSAFCTRVFAN